MTTLTTGTTSRPGRDFAPFQPVPFWQRQGYLQTHLDFLLREISPTLSRREMMARVVEVISETADTKTFVLRPPRRWQGFQAGMHLPMALELNGVRTHRTYSLSSTPDQFRRHGTVAITVKRQPGGKLSNALFHNLQPGQWLHIGQAAGEFTLAKSSRDKLLFLAAGSGITPLFSMLTAQSGKDIVLMYYCRSPEEVIFALQLEQLARTQPGFTLVIQLSGQHGRIALPHLKRYCPDATERDVFLCGPGGFMTSANSVLDTLGVAADRRFCESFGLHINPTITDAGVAADVVFTRTGLQVKGDGRHTLLELAEQAGLTPKYGCRSGLCHECTCRKLSGVVVDARSGKTLGPDATEIQACIAIPQGRVEIAL